MVRFLGWVDKVLSFLGFSDSSDEGEEIDSVHEMENYKKSNRTPVLSIHTSSEVKIVVVNPTSFEDARNLAEHLKNRKPIIVNFEKTPKDVAQRIIDFLSGTAFALNGRTSKITAETFLFVPNNVSIHSNDLTPDLHDRFYLKGSSQGV